MLRAILLLKLLTILNYPLIWRLCWWWCWCSSCLQWINCIHHQLWKTTLCRCFCFVFYFILVWWWYTNISLWFLFLFFIWLQQVDMIKTLRKQPKGNKAHRCWCFVVCALLFYGSTANVYAHINVISNSITILFARCVCHMCNSIFMCIFVLFFYWCNWTDEMAKKIIQKIETFFLVY